MVKEAEIAKIDAFIKKNPKYKKGEIPKTKCIGTKYPYFNSASLIMIINRVYPRLA